MKPEQLMQVLTLARRDLALGVAEALAVSSTTPAAPVGKLIGP